MLSLLLLLLWGMAVHPNFLTTPVSLLRSFVNRWVWTPSCLLFVSTAGWAGGGNLLAIYKALGNVRRKIQVVFLCGHNKNLYELLK